MKSRLIALGVCAVVLAGLLAAYYMLKGRPEQDEPEQEEEEYYTILEHAEEELASFSITSDGETLTFLPDADSGTGWRLSTDARIELDPYYTSSLLRGVTELGTVGLAVASTDDRSAFGLEPPQASSKIEYKNGKSDELLLGYMTPDKEYYYFMREGDPAVYLLNTYAGEKYAFKLKDMIDMGVSQVSMSELTYVYIKNADRELEIAPSDTSNELAAYGIVSLKMSKPYPGRDVYLTNFTEDVLSGLNDLRFDELVEVGLENERTYGLTAGGTQIIVRDEENEIHLMIGDEAGDGKLYARRAGDEMIFTLDSAYIDNFRNIDVLSFMDRFVALINIDSVEKILISEGDANVEILMNAEILPAEDGEEEGSIEQHPTIDGKEVELSEFQTFYQGIIGLSFDSELSGFDPGDGKPAYGITYYLTTGEITECKYYNYNDNFYAVSVDNAPVQFVVGKQSVNTVQRLMKQLVSGEQ